MIVSASRRTDIPALYSAWLRTRIREGYALVPHPFRRDIVRRVDLRPPPEGPMKALILWTRNPAPLLSEVPDWEARGLRTLWLVTLTGYPAALEPRAPRERDVVPALKELSRLVGPERISWRYDPVLLCPAAGLSAQWHRDNLRRLASLLSGTTHRCILSFYDDYAKARRTLRKAGLTPAEPTGSLPLAAALAAECRDHGFEPRSCSEDLEAAGIQAGACIDGELLDRLWSLGTAGRLDPGQRRGCRCAPSVDLGVYDTCLHGCLYCYATRSGDAARTRFESHSAEGERLV